MVTQVGKRVLITGANSGIGFETAKAMALHGAEVILACRNDDTLAALRERTVQEAMADIRGAYPEARVAFLEVDLARQAGLKAAARAFHDRFDRLDVLINNAGVMWLPESKTEDGFETQIGINHFGHFALTGLLLPALLKTPNSRVVTVSSLAHVTAALDLDDLGYVRRKYQPRKVYSQTKLANLLFARELGRRLASAEASTLSVAAHPGVASTNLFASAFPGSRRLQHLFARGIAGVGNSPAEGARPTLYAATDPTLKSGDYVGPKGFLQLRGRPGLTYSTKASRDASAARKLWEISERATGVVYDFDRCSSLTPHHALMPEGPGDETRADATR
jgi:NAD(P)-dependent dehydrogenase (short-subunit alcohol dehydrogenase family)